MTPTPDMVLATFWGPPMWPHGKLWLIAMLALTIACVWFATFRTPLRAAAPCLGARPAVVRLVKMES